LQNAVEAEAHDGHARQFRLIARLRPSLSTAGKTGRGGGSNEKLPAFHAHSLILAGIYLPITITIAPRARPRARRSVKRKAALMASDLQRLEKGDALLRQLHVLLDEVTLDPADPRRSKRLDPVDAALPDRRLHASTASPASRACTGWRSWRRCRRQWRSRVQVHVLDVHREKAARIPGEVFVGDESLADGGHLELELDQLPIGKTGEVRVTKRRAHLDGLNADVGQRLRQPGKVAVLDHLPVGICLTADGQSQRIGASLDDARGEEPGDGRIRRRRLQELSSGKYSHRPPPFC